MTDKTINVALAIPALLLAIGVSQPVLGQDSMSADTARQINQANSLVREGKFDEAVQEYGQVLPSDTDRSELEYNLAVAHFRKGEIEAAEGLFTSAVNSVNTTLAAKSRYNLGNCLYSKALKTAEQDKSAAIMQLQAAISHFRASLESNPDNNTDARANIELAGELIRKLKEEQEQENQQDQQKQDQQNQDQQNQDQQNQDQQNQDQQNQDQQNQDQQNQDQQNQDQQNQDQQNQDQQNQDQQNQDQQNQDQQNQDQQNQDQQNRDQQNRDQQNQDQQNQDQQNQGDPQQGSEQESEQQPPSRDSVGRPQDQNPRQNQTPAQQQESGEPDPGDELGDEDQQNQAVPTGELSAAGEEGEQPNGSIATVDPNAKDGLMSKEEALKMLQAVRDRDMLRRLRQDQLERSRHVPVDRDW